MKMYISLSCFIAFCFSEDVNYETKILCPVFRRVQLIEDLV